MQTTETFILQTVLEGDMDKMTGVAGRHGGLSGASVEEPR